MIVVDTSALMAIVLAERDADACVEALDRAEAVLLAAPTLTEVDIVAARRDLAPEMADLLDGLQPRIVPLTGTLARAASLAYRRWGKGYHQARLNICDCFAYALAKDQGCPLLFVGQDFAKTDIVAALAADR